MSLGDMSAVHDRIGEASVGDRASSSKSDLVQLTGTYTVASGIDKQDVIDILALRTAKARDAAKIAAWTFLEDQINRELVQASVSSSTFSTLQKMQCTITDKHVVDLMQALSSSYSSSDDDDLDVFKKVLIPSLTLCKTGYVKPQAFITCKDNMSFILATHFDLLCEIIPFFIRGLTFLALDRFGIIINGSCTRTKNVGHVTQQTLSRTKAFLAEMHVLYGIMTSDSNTAISDDVLAAQKALVALTNCTGDPLHEMFLKAEPHLLDK